MCRDVDDDYDSQQKFSSAVKAILRLRRRRVEMLPASPSRICRAKKAAKRTTKPTRRPIILELFQGVMSPPSCRAMRRQVVEPRRRTAPAQSMCRMRWRTERVCLSGGGLHQRMTIMAVIAPGGKLIQKASRQPTLLEVMAPPMIGPQTAPAPYLLINSQYTPRSEHRRMNWTYAAPMRLVMTGWRRRGSELAAMARTPTKTPP